MAKHKAKTASSGVMRPVLIGVLVGIAVTVLGLLVCAGVTAKFYLPVSALPTLGCVCYLAGAVGCGFTAGLLFGKQGALVGAICGALWLILFVLGYLLSGAHPPQVMTYIKAGAGFFGCLLGGLLGTVVRGRKEKRRYTYG